MGAPLLLLATLAADRVDGALAGRGFVAALGWRAAWAAAALIGAVAAARISADVVRWYPEPLGVARGRLRVDATQRALLRGAITFLERCARPEEPVFAAPDLAVLYFLAARPNPTRFDLVIPGNVSGVEIVESLERSRTRCVVYNPRMYPQFRPFAELFPEVARHLETRFRRAAELGRGEAVWYGLEREEPAR